MDAATLALMIPIISVIGLFTFLTVMIISVTNHRRLAREKLYEVARVAVDKGQPLPPEVIAALSDLPSARRTSFSDLRTGVILIGAGAGIAFFGFLIGQEERDAYYPMMGIGSIPLLIGVALVVLSFFNPNKDRAR